MNPTLQSALVILIYVVAGLSVLYVVWALVVARIALKIFKKTDDFWK